LVLLVVGLIAVVIGIIYLAVPAHSLPSFMGRVHTVSGHRSKRAIASLVVGGLLVAGAVIAFVRSRAYAR